MSAEKISRCLITLSRAKSPGGPNVAAWDLAAGAIQIVQLPRCDRVWSMVTGAAADDSFLFFAVQTADETRPYFYGGGFSLLVLNGEDLSFAALHPLHDLWDIHSVCLHQDRLYLVSTGTDELIALELDGANIVSQTVAWRPLPQARREDIHHLNTLISWNGSLIISGFGQKPGPLWSSATNGFLYDVTAGRQLLSGLAQPHSMLPNGGDLLVCESLLQRVRSVNGGRCVQLDGYTRGLASIGGRIAVGVSRGRRRSRSSGQLNNWGSPGGSGGQCGMYWLNPETLQVEGFTGLNFCSDEIYEILPMDDFGAWPVAPDLEWRDAAIAGFDLATERLRLQHDQQIAGYQSALDNLNREMCSKIDEANGIIRNLNKMLAEQSRWAQRSVQQVKDRDRTIRALQRQLGGAGDSTAQSQANHLVAGT